MQRLPAFISRNTTILHKNHNLFPYSVKVTQNVEIAFQGFYQYGLVKSNNEQKHLSMGMQKQKRSVCKTTNVIASNFDRNFQRNQDGGTKEGCWELQAAVQLDEMWD